MCLTLANASIAHCRVRWPQVIRPRARRLRLLRRCALVRLPQRPALHRRPSQLLPRRLRLLLRLPALVSMVGPRLVLVQERQERMWDHFVVRVVVLVSSPVLASALVVVAAVVVWVLVQVLVQVLVLALVLAPEM